MAPEQRGSNPAMPSLCPGDLLTLPTFSLSSKNFPDNRIRCACILYQATISQILLQDVPAEFHLVGAVEDSHERRAQGGVDCQGGQLQEGHDDGGAAGGEGQELGQDEEEASWWDLSEQCSS